MKVRNFIKLINEGKIIIPDEIINKWQETVDLLSEVLKVPAALIMKVDPPNIEVFGANSAKDNPFKDGQIYELAGVYCEKVINSKKKLLAPNTLKDKKWDHNPDLEFNMILYLGFPIICPDGSIFGMLCVSDTKENRYNKQIETLMIQYKGMIESHLKSIYQNFLVNESLNALKKQECELKKENIIFKKNQILYADGEMRIYGLQNEVDDLRRKFGLPPKYFFVSKK